MLAIKKAKEPKCFYLLPICIFQYISVGRFLKESVFSANREFFQQLTSLKPFYLNKCILLGETSVRQF